MASVMTLLKLGLLLFAVLILLPLGISAVRYELGAPGADWRSADRSSAGLLPRAAENPEAVVRI